MTEHADLTKRPLELSSPLGHSIALGLATLWSLYLCALILKPFVTVLAWSLALGVATRPIYSAIIPRVTNRSIAALIATTIAALVMCAPIYWVGHVLVLTAIEHATSLINRPPGSAWFNLSTAPPRLAAAIAWVEESMHIEPVIRDFIQTFAQRLPHMVTMSLVGVVQIALVLFTTFFFIRDADLFLSQVKKNIPLPPHHVEATIRRTIDTVHATIFGIVLVSLFQGLLGGIIFWWLELPRATLWGLVMALLAIVPYLGAFIIWIPTAIILAIDGAWGDAILLAFWGMTIVGLSDNLLYPVLVGRRLHYHTLLMFIFLCGGVIAFGAAGIVLGPLILALSHSLIRLWQLEEPAIPLPSLTPPSHKVVEQQGIDQEAVGH